MSAESTEIGGVLSVVPNVKCGAIIIRKESPDRVISRRQSICHRLLSHILPSLIGFFLIWHPSARAQMDPIQVSGGALVKMAADLQRPYIYALQAPVTPGQKGNLLFINTTNNSIEKTLAIGSNPTDLAIHYGENRLYIASWQESATYVVDLNTQSLLPSLNLGADIYKINAGKPGRIITEGQNQWIAINIVDTASGNVVGTMPYPEYQGDGKADPNGAFYFHADSSTSGDRIHKFKIENDTVTDITNSVIRPYGSRNLVMSPDGSRLYWQGYVYDTNLTEIRSLGEEIRAATLHADLALGIQHAFDKRTGQAVYTWPFSSDVMAVSGDQQKVFLFNSASNQLVVVPMTTIAPMPGLAQNPAPANGARVSFPLAQISWAADPQALSYQVYLGTNGDAVASADAGSALCLGTTFENFLALPALANTNAGTAYYWRVDAMGVSGATTGAVWAFAVSVLTVSPQTLTASGVAQYPVSPLSLSITAASQTPWTLEIQQPWLSASLTNGSTPALLTLNIDTTHLKSGFHTNTIAVIENGNVLRVSVVLHLVGLAATQMATDPNRDCIYVLHPGSGISADAFLLFINTQSGTGEKVIPIGINPTDMSINRFEDRLYVSNCGQNQTRVVDLKTQTELAPLLLGTNVYKINAGLPGRLVIEGSPWLNYSRLIDTTNGTVLWSEPRTMADGQCDPSGRYYYHEYLGWYQAINKYDIEKDTFDFQRVAYGSTDPGQGNIVMSLDGSILFWKGGVYDSDLNAYADLGSVIWSCSTNGAIASSDQNGFDRFSGRKVFTLDVPTLCTGVDRRNQSLWHFNGLTGLIESNPLDEMMIPKIKAQPQDQTDYSGTEHVLRVDGTGVSPLACFWFLNGTNCAVTTNFEYTISNSQASHAGNYFMVVSNAFGTIRSSNFVFRVEDAAPVILSQPASTNRLGQTNITFVVETIGSLPMSYQWQFNGTNLEGATNNVLALRDLSNANEGNYALIISNRFGLAATTNAWLDVFDRPDALNSTNMVWDFGTSQSWFTEFSTTHDGVAALQNGTVKTSRSSTMRATVAGPGRVSFWWSFHSYIPSDYLRFSIDGVARSVITGGVSWQLMTYDVASGTNVLEWTFEKADPVVGADAAGWVDQVTFIPGGFPPTLTKAPVSQVVLLGDYVTFSAAAAGTPPLRYQWQCNGTNLEGANDPNLTLTYLRLSDEGNYSLVISNEFGVTNTASALLNVVDSAESLNATNLTWKFGGDWPWNPEMSTTHDGVAALQSARIFPGQQSKFQTTVNGPGTLTYWWRCYSTSDADFLNVTINGVEKARISRFTEWNARTIYLDYGTNVIDWCYLRNDASVSVDAAGWVDQVSYTPGITPPFVTLAAVSQVVFIGSNVTFKAAASGTPPLSYQWQFNGTNLDGATNATLALSNVQFTDEGSYRLAISNSAGVTNTPPALLNVVDLTEAANATNLVWASAGEQPWGPETSNTHDGVAALQSGAIDAGRESTAMTIVNGPGTLQFWWAVSANLNSNYLHFDIDGIEKERISGGISWAQKTYYVTPGSHILAWTYSKSAPNNGWSDCAYLDQVSYVPGGTAPFMTLNPTNQAGRLSSDVTFTASAFGTPPLTYQWLRNDVALANETNASLTIRHFQTANIGAYAVRVANDYGSALSAAAQLNLMNVFAWGAGTNKTGGSYNYGQSIVPTNLYATAIASGGYHSLALQPDGRVKGWGYGMDGQINIPATLTNASAISAGFYHSLALRSNGTVSAWGYANFNLTKVPTNATNMAAIAAGGYHNLTLQSNGLVVAWGAGTSRSGFQNFGQAMVPTNLSGVAAIAAGGYHSLALKKNGTVIAWGLNTSGQTNVPIGLSNVVAIAAGESNSIALKADGNLIAWGANRYGQTNIPTGLSNVVAISCGAAHVMALQKDGTLVAWGRNLEGQTNVPITLTNVTSISAGGYHCMAMVNFGPVTFLNSPYSQKVFFEGEVTFSPAFLGTPPMTCQWLKNGTNVVNATNASLTIENLQRADSGAYQLVVSNVYGIRASGMAALKVMDMVPYFDEQPISLSVFSNSNPTLEPVVSGYPPLSFQWQFNGIPIPWATNSDVTLTNVQFSNEGTYSLIVSNQYGTITSSNAFLNIVDLAEAMDATNLVWTSSGQKPWFVQSTNTHDGIAAAAVGPLPVYAESLIQTSVTGPGTISFWWADSFNTTFTFLIDGTTRAIWQQSSGSIWGNATFYLAAGRHVLTWKAGNTRNPFSYPSCMAYLDQVKFTPGSTLPGISRQPKSQTLAAGANATFTVAAVGTPPLGFQWYSNLVSIPGATGAAYTISNVQSDHAASYSVVVTNDFGLATSTNAILKVTPSAPTILTQTGNLQIMVGGQATFNVGAVGSNPLSYQWMFNDSPLLGETGPTLTRTNIHAVDGGNYYLVVSNTFGSVNSTNALLQVYTLNDLTASVNESRIAWSTTNVPWLPQSNTTHDGVSAAQSGVITDKQQTTLQGTVSGPATITFWWKVNCDSFWDSLAFGVNGTIQNSITGIVDWQKASHYIGAGTNILTWSLYPVHAAYAGGTAWLDEVQISPGGTAAIINSNSSDIVTNAGNNVTLSVAATGTPPLFYQWAFSGTNLPGATKATLALNNVQGGNAGIYTVVVTNDFGFATSSNMTLVVNAAAPMITQQPASQSGVINGNAVFAVAAKGSIPLQYQWRHNEVEIPGATNTVLRLSSLQLTNVGNYNVRISNDLGSMTSSIAVLEVSSSAVLEYWDRFSQPYATPLGVSNVVAVAAGSSHTAALREDGTILCWGSYGYGPTNVPADLSNVVSISAGLDHTAALKSDGTVAAWGDNSYGQLAVPEGLSNVTAIAASGNDTFALKSDGTVVAWGDNANGQLNVPLGMSNVVAIFAGNCNGFALKTDGSVVQWGNGPVWQSNGIPMQLNVTEGISNISAVAAGRATAWLLLDDGTVQPRGLSAFEGFDGIAAVSAASSYLSFNTDYALCLGNDGTLTPSDYDIYTPRIPNSLSNVVAFSAGYRHAAVLVNDGAPRVVRTFLNRTAYTGAKVVLRSGVAGAYPMRYQWQFNGTNLDGATNVTLVLDSVTLDSAGNYSCIAGNAFGSATNTAATLAVLRSAAVFNGLSHFTEIGFAMQLGQLSGHGNIVIMASTNLIDWVPIFTNAPVTGSLLYCDPEATTQPRRFYRAVEQ